MNHKLTLLVSNSEALPPTVDEYQKLIDLKNFKFLATPQVCNNALLLLVLVFSSRNNYNRRMTIRKSWGTPTDWNKVVFLVGEPDPRELFHDIQEENQKHKDIVIGNFVDTYRNLTYKHVMGLKWTAHHCPTAKYVLRTDDDVVVESKDFKQFLIQMLSPWGARGLLAGNVCRNAMVTRSRNDRWAVSKKEYPRTFYPTYCSGWVVLYSQDVAQKLLNAAQSLPFFWIEDVHITGTCANKIKVPRTSLGRLVLFWKRMFVPKNRTREYNSYPIYNNLLIIYLLNQPTLEISTDSRILYYLKVGLLRKGSL